jgi:hypothetical protein
MNTTLSFRKESIQRSSHANESMNQAQEGHGMRGAREQRPISIGTLFTLTQ